jgi:hypothetical protein
LRRFIVLYLSYSGRWRSGRFGLVRIFLSVVSIVPRFLILTILHNFIHVHCLGRFARDKRRRLGPVTATHVIPARLEISGEAVVLVFVTDPSPLALVWILEEKTRSSRVGIFVGVKVVVL